MNTNQRPLLFRYRLCLAAFIIGLIVSGLTAFPLRTELSILSKLIGISDPAASVDAHGLRHWVGFVDVGLREPTRASDSSVTRQTGSRLGTLSSRHFSFCRLSIRHGTAASYM